MRSCIAPILCICYSNHALDQFLVGLLDANVTNIIRVGGNSRCNRLEPYNLRCRAKPSFDERACEIRKEILPGIEEILKDETQGYQRGNM